MESLKLCESDYRFMTVVWENEPVSSGALVKLCQEKLGWKKSTTYTVLRKMTEKGFLVNHETEVTSIVAKEKVQAYESDYFVNRTFDGSLPQFLTAFFGGKTISKEEAERLKALIENHQEEA